MLVVAQGSAVYHCCYRGRVIAGHKNTSTIAGLPRMICVRASCGVMSRPTTSMTHFYHKQAKLLKIAFGGKSHFK